MQSDAFTAHAKQNMRQRENSGGGHGRVAAARSRPDAKPREGAQQRLAQAADEDAEGEVDERRESERRSASVYVCDEITRTEKGAG